MTTAEILAQIAAIEAALAAAAENRVVAVKQSVFRGWDVPFGLPEIGATIRLSDYADDIHDAVVIDHDGAYWSDTTAGRSGRWIHVRVPPTYRTREQADLHMRLARLEIDDLPDAYRTEDEDLSPADEAAVLAILARRFPRSDGTAALRELVAASGLTARAAAERIGIQRDTLRQFLRGRPPLAADDPILERVRQALA